jgi:hypothetical protein
MAKIIHISNIETKDNKVNKIDSTATHDQYPSAKAVYDALQDLGINTGDVDLNASLSDEQIDSLNELLSSAAYVNSSMKESYFKFCEAFDVDPIDPDVDDTPSGGNPSIPPVNVLPEGYENTGIIFGAGTADNFGFLPCGLSCQAKTSMNGGPYSDGLFEYAYTVKSDALLSYVAFDKSIEVGKQYMLGYTYVDNRSSSLRGTPVKAYIEFYNKDALSKPHYNGEIQPSEVNTSGGWKTSLGGAWSLVGNDWEDFADGSPVGIRITFDSQQIQLTNVNLYVKTVNTEDSVDTDYKLCTIIDMNRIAPCGVSSYYDSSLANYTPYEGIPYTRTQSTRICYPYFDIPVSYGYSYKIKYSYEDNRTGSLKGCPVDVCAEFYNKNALDIVNSTTLPTDQRNYNEYTSKKDGYGWHPSDSYEWDLSDSAFEQFAGTLESAAMRLIFGSHEHGKTSNSDYCLSLNGVVIKEILIYRKKKVAINGGSSDDYSSYYPPGGDASLFSGYNVYAHAELDESRNIRMSLADFENCNLSNYYDPSEAGKTPYKGLPYVYTNSRRISFIRTNLEAHLGCEYMVSYSYEDNRTASNAPIQVCIEFYNDDALYRIAGHKKFNVDETGTLDLYGWQNSHSYVWKLYGDTPVKYTKYDTVEEFATGIKIPGVEDTGKMSMRLTFGATDNSDISLVSLTNVTIWEKPVHISSDDYSNYEVCYEMKNPSLELRKLSNLVKYDYAYSDTKRLSYCGFDLNAELGYSYMVEYDASNPKVEMCIEFYNENAVESVTNEEDFNATDMMDGYGWHTSNDNFEWILLGATKRPTRAATWEQFAVGSGAMKMRLTFHHNDESAMHTGEITNIVIKKAKFNNTILPGSTSIVLPVSTYVGTLDTEKCGVSNYLDISTKNSSSSQYKNIPFTMRNSQRICSPHFNQKLEIGKTYILDYKYKDNRPDTDPNKGTPLEVCVELYKTSLVETITNNINNNNVAYYYNTSERKDGLRWRSVYKSDSLPIWDLSSPEIKNYAGASNEVYARFIFGCYNKDSGKWDLSLQNIEMEYARVHRKDD